jgi:peptidyl-prolyl cis-trans isomerase D
VLQHIRDKVSGWFAMVFLGAVAVVFIFFGVNLRDTAIASYAAKVNGETVSLQTVRNAWQQQQQRMLQMFHGDIPDALVKSQQHELLEQHIRAQLLTEHVRDLGYRVSDQALLETIEGFPEVNVDGKFSRTTYEAAVRQQGRSIQQFESELRANLEIRQLQGSISDTAFVTPIEMARRNALQNEQREIDYITIKSSAFLASVKVSDADIQKWYDEHKAEYTTPESVDLEYIELKLADVEKNISVSDDALKGFYEQVKERFVAPERRLARHILIAVEGSDDASKTAAEQKVADDAAKKTADEVLVKLKSGADFAALAKQYSKDPGSADKGGDLDWAERGTFVGPFEDALFSMTKGELRGPIKTQFGYHIIQLRDAEDGKVKSFDEVRAELEKDYRADRAQTEFYEQSQKLADQSFSSLTELESVAKSLGLSLQKVANFSRQNATPFENEPKVAEAAFSPSVIERSENSALIKLAEDHVMVLRDAAHHPAEPLALASVKDKIETQLKNNAAKDAAAARSAELLAQLQSGATLSAVAAREKLTPSGKHFIGRAEKDVPAELITAAFHIPRSEVTADKPSNGSADLVNGDHLVYAVSAVRVPALEYTSPEGAAKIREAKQAIGSDEFNGYVLELVRGAKIERNPNAFE